MMQRTTVALNGDTHKYLTGVAHEQSLATGKRVSLATVVAGICDVAVEEMRRTAAAKAAAAKGVSRG